MENKDKSIEQRLNDNANKSKDHEKDKVWFDYATSGLNVPKGWIILILIFAFAWHFNS
ncbi:MAG: hypothetical protein HOI53_09455 [Francisellaceae bacterium]|jgi:hypothetical protein|nr:hypothetical protein [Francisellaceae bacterium]MBT6208239.1 hypothetical protein [Francisellaceae bacterium]MBT6539186.1 hypothetical protein [Francisellaceae bacterium]